MVLSLAVATSFDSTADLLTANPTKKDLHVAIDLGGSDAAKVITAGFWTFAASSTIFPPVLLDFCRRKKRQFQGDNAVSYTHLRAHETG